MGGFIGALSYSATTYSAFMLVGLAGLTYAGGVGASGLRDGVLLGAGVLVAFFGPRFLLAGKKFGYVTPSEMLGDRYGSRGVAVVCGAGELRVPHTVQRGAARGGRVPALGGDE